MTMAAIGRQTPPNLTSKSFSIWGGQISHGHNASGRILLGGGDLTSYVV